MKNNILIVNPEISYNEILFPYLYFVLKSYYLENGKHHQFWNWPLPINNVENLTFEEIVNKIVSESPKVIGFSCYIWNYTLNLKISKAVKEKLPDSVIVFGGPHVLYKKSPNWFSEQSWVDLICNGEGGRGEEMITDILDQLVEGKLNPEQISFCVYPSEDRNNYFVTKKAPKISDFKWPKSMFNGSEIEAKLIKYMADVKGVRVNSIWETNRGCPYKCSYCDWGGGTGTKVVKKSEETIYQELKFMEELDFEYIDFCDANFGIFKDKDLKIIEYLIERKKSGWDLVLGFNGKAKNDIELVKKLDIMLLESKLTIPTGYRYSINAIENKSAEAVNRKSYPLEKHKQFLNEISKYGYETKIELILGLPESTIESFYNEFNLIADVNAWFSERHLWSLLPNSPAADPAYMEKYKIKTKKVKYTHQSYLKQKQSLDYYIFEDEDFLGDFEVVVETSSYTFQEWIEMFVMENVAKAFEKYGLTSKLRLLDSLNGVPASEFFKKIWNSLSTLEGESGEAWSYIIGNVKKALDGEGPFFSFKYERGSSKLLGLQNIALLFVAEYRDEFLKQLSKNFVLTEEYASELKIIESKLSEIYNSDNSLDFIINKNLNFIYKSSDTTV